MAELPWLPIKERLCLCAEVVIAPGDGRVIGWEWCYSVVLVRGRCQQIYRCGAGKLIFSDGRDAMMSVYICVMRPVIERSHAAGSMAQDRYADIKSGNATHQVH